MKWMKKFLNSMNSPLGEFIELRHEVDEEVSPGGQSNTRFFTRGA